MNFKDALSEWRKGTKLLQKEVADRLGVPLQTYRKWESGKRTPPKYTAAVVLEKLGLPNDHR